MRGSTTQQIPMLSVLTPEQLVPEDHPLRRIKVIVDRALAELSPVFDDMYAANGSASIPPEWLLKGCLLIALYSIRSERQLCEQLQYNLLFKWFLDMDVETPAFDSTTFTKNRDRLLSHEVAPRFFHAVVAQAKAARLISAEHFTVDGTLLEVWASLKSFQPRDAADHRPRGGGGGTRNPDVDFRGAPRRNDTHVSTTDPDARLFTKGVHQTAKLCYGGNVLMENRRGLVVHVLMAPAGGRAERETGLRMLRRQGVVPQPAGVGPRPRQRPTLRRRRHRLVRRWSGPVAEWREAGRPDPDWWMRRQVVAILV
jgi:transposase